MELVTNSNTLETSFREMVKTKDNVKVSCCFEYLVNETLKTTCGDFKTLTVIGELVTPLLNWMDVCILVRNLLDIPLNETAYNLEIRALWLKTIVKAHSEFGYILYDDKSALNQYLK